MRSSRRSIRSVTTSTRGHAAELGPASLSALAALAAGAAVALAGPAVGIAAPAAGAAAAERITFGDVTCAPGWPPPTAGRDRFEVVNRSSRSAAVYLFRADSGRIVAAIRGLRAGAARRLTVRLTPGPYAWGCDLRGYPRHVSEADRVTTHHQRGPVVVPVVSAELAGPLRSYRRYAASTIRRLVTEVAGLHAALLAGHTMLAETDWLTAHESWLALGQDDGAYGAFGSLGRSIDGTAAGLVDGDANPHFTGFHRVELDLFERHELGAATTDSARLVALVGRLSQLRLGAVLPTTRLGENSWTLRCHEVLEDALRDSLTGDDDYGSRTDLDSLTADVSVTRRLLAWLAPLLAPRAPRLVDSARRQLARIDAVIAGAGDRPIAISALPRRTRERVDAAADAALETLAPVPDLLRIGTT